MCQAKRNEDQFLGGEINRIARDDREPLSCGHIVLRAMGVLRIIQVRRISWTIGHKAGSGFGVGLQQSHDAGHFTKV
jgi:hypothetical protein